MTDELRIVGWEKYDEEKYPCREDDDETIRLVACELRKHGYHFNGEYHQNGEHGAPVFSDGTQLQTYQRAWGAIMQAAYPDEVDSYLPWAWNYEFQRQFEKFPEEDGI